jgi:PTH2 family peptidyl-tRNA hydrolase
MRRDESKNTHKMVIVMRKFPSLRNGKYIAQACHAACSLDSQMDGATRDWWEHNGEKKVVLYVESEQELLDIYDKANKKGLTTVLCRDAGLTEFTEPTYTCVGIGPEDDEYIDPITGHLPLF